MITVYHANLSTLASDILIKDVKMFRIIKKIFIKYRISKHAILGRNVIVFNTTRCYNDGEKRNIIVGNHCVLGCSLYARNGGKIRIGNNTYIGPNTSIQAKESIIIDDNVIVANNVIILDNNNHPVNPKMRLIMSSCKNYMSDNLWTWENAESKPVHICENVWIGRDARILKGVTIGKGSVIALGAIVTHNVPEYSIVAGNPAKIVKSNIRN